jgi:hypothetical protein
MGEFRLQLILFEEPLRSAGPVRGSTCPDCPVEGVVGLPVES